MNSIFGRIIQEHKNKFNTTTMFGTPIAEIDADGLRACVCILGEIQEEQRKSSQRERDMYKLFRSHGI
jgi:hypothetical protein